MAGSDAALRVAGQLRTELRAGLLHPRERLIEHELVERFASSRAVIRDALVQLAAEGVVERQPNRGARVRGLSVRDGIEYAQVRRELEALCAREAAGRADVAERERLHVMLDGLRAAALADDVVEYRRISAGFHGLIIDMAHHASAKRQLEAVRMHDLQRNFPRAFAMRSLLASEGEHEEIAQAVLAGDGGVAERCMHAHLDRVVQILVEYQADVSAEN
ncbi:MAG: GntR family transcriptional regulator [Pseudoclavibacter sp.]